MTTKREDLTSTGGPLLFDLPLDEAEPDTAAAAPEPVGAGAEPMPKRQMSMLESPAPAPPAPAPDPGSLDEESSYREPEIAGVVPRLISGGADLLVHAGVLAATVLGLFVMSATPRIDHWPAFLILLLAFSFFYTVISLAFWGQTAGMAWCELTSRDSLSRPLSFRQAGLRWLGGLLTTALAGLPVLLAYRGTSLTDLVSASITLQEPAAD